MPHTAATAPADEAASGSRAAIVEGGKGTALLRVIPAGLIVFVTLPLVILNWLLRAVSGKRIPSLIVGPLDRAVFTPYELRRFRHEHRADATHGFWARVGTRVAVAPGRVAVGSLVVLLLLCAGLGYFSTNLTTNDSYRTEVESVEGQEILSQAFPAGASAPADIIVPSSGEVAAVTSAVEGVDGVESVSPPVATGDRGVLVQATLEPQPYSTEAFDLIEPIRDAATGAAPGTLVGGASAVEFDVREAAARRLPPDSPDRARGGDDHPDRAAALGRRGGGADRDRDHQLPRRPRASATSSSTWSSTSPAPIRRCRCSRSCSWWPWGWTTTSSS